MKKYISIALTALLALTMFSCTKKADIAGIEPKLPDLKLSSLGYQQSSPFTLTTILQLNFGATVKKATGTGKFVVEVLDGTTVVSTVTFPSWSSNDLTSTPAKPAVPAAPPLPAVPAVAAVINHTISYVLQDTTYPNTDVYSGTILLRFNKLGLTVGKTYSIRASAYAADGTTVSVLTQSSFFKTI